MLCTFASTKETIWRYQRGIIRTSKSKKDRQLNSQKKKGRKKKRRKKKFNEKLHGIIRIKQLQPLKKIAIELRKGTFHSHTLIQTNGVKANWTLFCINIEGISQHGTKAYKRTKWTTKNEPGWLSGSSWSTSGTSRVTLDTNPLISQKRGHNEKVVTMTNVTHPWSYVTHILRKSVSDCCLAPTQQMFSYIMARTS